jgi:epoxyqueuosine reductase
METTADRRRHPNAMWPEARSIVMLGMSYAPDSDPLARAGEPDKGAISCYAQCSDYHDVVKSGLKRVAGALARESGADVKVFVDTAPLMEKPLGQAAGLGWQGKHTNLVSREHGSWLFLGAIMTSAELEPDAPEADRCGSCQRCIDVCPTNAFPAPYQLDARRCIAYLTIEHKATSPAEFRAAIGNRVFGCDDCLAVCPWNKFAEVAHHIKLKARDEVRSPRLAELLALDDAAFRRRFAGTPVKRTGRRPGGAQCADRCPATPATAACCRPSRACCQTPRRWCEPWRCGPATSCRTGGVGDRAPPGLDRDGR